MHLPSLVVVYGYTVFNEKRSPGKRFFDDPVDENGTGLTTARLNNDHEKIACAVDMMQVQYLGPLMMGLGHPALTGYDLGSFPPSCFAVELKEGAGLNGPLIEGDVLIADEDRLASNDDLAVAKVGSEHLLAHVWRIGGRVRLIPLQGRESLFVREDMLLGVVVSQARRYVL